MMIHLDLSKIDSALERMEKLFPRGKYELTLIARYVGQDDLDGDVLLTRDDLGKVRELCEKYALRDPRFRAGDKWP